MSSSVVGFDGPAPPGTINFGLGQPSPDLLPVDLIRQASEAFFREAQPPDLNYGDFPGDSRFLETLAGHLSEAYGTAVSAEELFVTGGASQALDLVSTVLARPGDTIFVEEPSYFLAFQIFRDHGLRLVGIPVDEDGLDLERLEAELERSRPAFLYTIPAYQNPGGRTLSLERRQHLVELSRRHDFLIIADEVYQHLSWAEESPPAFGTMIESGTVLSLGSFSKVLAPALRLGWIQAGSSLRERLLAAGLVRSGGSVNQYASHIVRQAMALGLLEQHVKALCRAYAPRSLAMDAALHEHFSDIAEWIRPDGGYFFWLRLGAEVDTTALKDVAASHRVGFQPGSLFSSTGSLRNCLRLCFAHYDETDIREGIARLRALFGSRDDS